MTYDITEILNDITDAFDNITSFSSCDCDDVIDCICATVGKNKYNYDYGATKFVLIPKDKEKDYVIKIPFTGSWDDWEEEYTSFYYSDNSNSEWDYCAAEQERYNTAKDYGFAEYFAKTEFIAMVNDYIPVYVQERCVTHWNSNAGEHSDEEISTTNSLTCNYCKINSEWLTDFRLYFGDDILIKFINFLEEFNWDNDLSYNNVGYLNGKPVLIDYSGFYD